MVICYFQSKNKQMENTEKRTTRKYRIIFRIIIYLIFCVGCCYQVTRYLIIYFQYPIVVDIQEKPVDAIEPPGITICSSNGVHRTRYCKENPQKCKPVENISELCRKRRNFCENLGNFSSFKNLMIPEKPLFAAYLAEYKKAAVRENELIPNCTLVLGDLSTKSCSADYYLMNDRLPSSEGTCYVFNLRFSRASWDEPLISTRMAPLYSAEFFIDFLPHEYFSPELEVEGNFAIHSPFSIEDPSIYGKNLDPGYIYTVLIKPVKKHLLESPYPTNCFDYVSQWKKNNYKGPLSMASCLSECDVKQQKEQINCILRDNFYPHDYNLCVNDEKFSDNVDCYSFCNRPCDSLEYEYDVEEREISSASVKEIKNLLKSSKYPKYKLFQIR
ncbi:uncharacterized protein [Centruroides vittatus]|uniref:uncharacterized protein n=1 Tax=Centruroides vittatus TaxID=120091 RepID=UPI00350EC478